MSERFPYFGWSDSNQESIEDLLRYFYETSGSVFGKLKTKSSPSGISIVVAPKGAGKTQLRRILAHEASDDHDIAWEIDQNFGRQISDIETKGPAQIKRELSGILLTGITAKLLMDASLGAKVGAQWKEKAKEIFDRVGGVVKGLGAAGISVDLDLTMIFRDKEPKFDQAPVEKYQEVLNNLLSDRRAYILIDDVDEIFRQAYTSPKIVEGLLRAAVELNIKFRDRMHVIVFLKAGLYAAYFQKAQAHNEIRDHVGFLRWREREIVDLLARRISKNSQLAQPYQTTDELWSLEFDSNGASMGELQQYMTARCNSGPRDLIYLANDAKKLAGDAKITIEHIKAAESGYFTEKIQLINADYGQAYPGLDELITTVFTGKETEYSREDFEAFVRNNVVQNDDFARHEPFRSWVRFAPERRLISVFYEMGLIGFSTGSGQDYTYVMSRPNPGDFENRATSYRIHPAYSLGLQLHLSRPTASCNPANARVPTSP